MIFCIVTVAFCTLLINRLQSISTDVDGASGARKRTREALGHEEQHFRVLFEASDKEFHTDDISILESSLLIKSLIDDGDEEIRINQANSEINKIDIPSDLCPDDSSNAIIDFWNSKAMHFFTVAIHQVHGYKFAKLHDSLVENIIIQVSTD